MTPPGLKIEIYTTGLFNIYTEIQGNGSQTGEKASITGPAGSEGRRYPAGTPEGTQTQVRENPPPPHLCTTRKNEMKGCRTPKSLL